MNRCAALLALSMVAWLALACTSSPPKAPGFNATISNEGGSVTIEVTWTNWENKGAGPSFEVVMDTHSVSLDDYNLGELAVLRVDGSREVLPTAWEAPPGGHHRSGRLDFPARDAAGQEAIGAGTHTVELLVRDVAGVKERRFRWELPR